MEEKVPLTPVMSWGISLIAILLPEKSGLSKGQSFTKIRTSSRIQTHISWGYNLSCPWLCMDLENLCSLAMSMLLTLKWLNGWHDGALSLSTGTVFRVGRRPQSISHASKLSSTLSQGVESGIPGHILQSSPTWDHFPSYPCWSIIRGRFRGRDSPMLSMDAVTIID